MVSIPNSYKTYYFYQLSYRLLTLFLILSTLTLSGQPITEGEFYYNTQVIPSPSHIITGFIFTPTKYAVVSLDKNGQLRGRIVYDFNSGLEYSFTSRENENFYFTKPLSNSPSFFKTQGNYLLMWGHKEQDVDSSNIEVAGFSCTKVKSFSRGYDSRVCYSTSSIRFPKFTYPHASEIKSILDSTVILKTIIDSKSGPIIIEVDTVYPSIIHTEWLSTDTSGLPTIIEFRNHKDDKVIENWLKNTMPKGDGLEKGYTLYKEGLLSPFNMKQLISSNRPIDELNLMLFTQEDNRKKPPLTLFEAFHKQNLISSESFILLKTITEDRSANYSWHDMREILIIVKMKEYFNNTIVRSNIVHNLKALGYQFKKDKSEVIEAFLRGEGFIDDLFLALQYLEAAPRFYPTNDLRELEVSANQLLNKFFPSLSDQVQLKLDTSNAQMNIIVTSKRDTIEYFYPYSYFWSNNEKNSLSGIPMEYFRFDENFINRLLSIMEQIKCDNGIKNIINFDHFASIIEKIDIETYFELKEIYPEISMFGSSHFTFSIPIDNPVISNLGSIPIIWTIPYAEEILWETEINDFTRNANSGDYFTSKTKKEFVSFLSKNEEVFNLSETNIRELKNQFLRKLIPKNKFGIEELLSFSYSVDLLGFGSSDNSDLNFASDTSSFQTQFPALYSFFQGDIYGKNLQANNGGTKLSWLDSSGATIEIPLNHSSVRKCIIEYFARSQPNPEKRIYVIPSLALSKKSYYYLTDEQRNTLEKLLGVRFLQL